MLNAPVLDQSSDRKNGIKKTKQATKKNTDPTIDQKLPMEAMINPSAERIKRIQPMKLICLLLMATPNVRAAVPDRLMVYFVNTTSLLLLGCAAVVGLAL